MCLLGSRSLGTIEVISHFCFGSAPLIWRFTLETIGNVRFASILFLNHFGKATLIISQFHF